MDYSDKLKMLVKKLSKSEKVNSYDQCGERESDTLAHSLLDMEESFKIILDDLLPQLNLAKNGNEIDEALLDIGEELRHILYHIRDPKYFKYISVQNE